MSNPIRYDMNGPRRLYGEGYGTGAAQMPKPPGDPALRDRIAALALQAPTDPQTGAAGTTTNDQPDATPTPATPAALAGNAPTTLSALLQSGGQTPVQSTTPPKPMTNQYTLGEVGNATIDRTPKTPFLQTGLGRAIRGGLAGLAQNLSPSAHGTAGFLGSLANSFTDTVNYGDAQRAGQAQEQEAQQRQSLVDQLMQAQTSLAMRNANAPYTTPNAPRPLVIPGVGIRDMNPDGTPGDFETDPSTGKRIVPPIPSVAGAEARGATTVTPADKLYLQLYNKYLGMKGLTGQPLYDQSTAAGMAVSGAQKKYPGYTVPGYQAPTVSSVTPGTSPTGVGNRLTAAGVDPSQVAAQVAKRRQATQPSVTGAVSRPTVGGKITVSQSDYDALRQDGMSPADIQEQYTVPVGVGDQ